jgi:hypothetical protein
MSIKFTEILPHELIQVLVDDGIEEHLYAKVIGRDSDKLYVSYLSPTSKIYKGACVYSFESKVEIVEAESISQHYNGVEDVGEIGVRKLDDSNHFVIESEIEEDGYESDIEDMSDSDSDESENSFIAEEDPDQWELPDDHKKVDDEWSAWTPSTVGGKQFKNTVDRLETYAKIHLDNLHLDKNGV